MVPFDFKNVIKALAPIIKQADCKSFVPETSPKDKPSYPFASYGFINNHLATGTDWNDHEPFEMTLEIQVHSLDMFEVMNKAEHIYKLLHTYQGSEYLDKYGLKLVDAQSPENSDNPISILVEYTVSLTIRLGVQDEFQED